MNILNEFRRYLELKNVSTADSYINDAVEYFEYLQASGKRYDSIKLKVAEEYRSYLVSREDKSLSHGTINNKLNRLRNFYRFLVKKGYFYTNPFYKVKGLKTGKSLPKDILSVEDIGILLNNFAVISDNDLMLKSVIELQYGSGLRINEVYTLKISDINYEQGLINVTDHKNDRLRIAPATENSLSALKEYIKKSRDKLTAETDRLNNYIYPQKKTTTLRCLLNRKLKRECKRLGIKQITSHSFRHSSATHLLRNGSGIREVQSFLGHSNIKNTEIYTRVVKEDLKNIVNKFHPREAVVNASY